MAARRKTITLPGGEKVDGVIVGISESTERWCEFILDDGARLKAKLVGLEALRLDDRTDQDGNPVYSLQNHVVTTLAQPPRPADVKHH